MFCVGWWGGFGCGVVWGAAVLEERAEDLDYGENERDGEEDAGDVEVEHELSPEVHQVEVPTEAHILIQRHLTPYLIVPIDQFQVPEEPDLFLINIATEHHIEETGLKSMNKFQPHPILPH